MSFKTRLNKDSVVIKVLNLLEELRYKHLPRHVTFDAYIWKDIKEALSYGFEPIYYMNANTYYPSLNEMYFNYTKGHVTVDKDKLFYAVTTVLPILYLGDNYELVVGVDENEQKYFQIKHK